MSSLLPTNILELRAGKVQKDLFSIKGFDSAIFKRSLPQEPIYLDTLGLHGDCHQYRGSGGPDKALLHYATSHYDSWKNELPSTAIIEHGGFGENILTGPDDGYTEHTICIGDVFSIGNDGVRIQVTQPRQPCYKLNHRFDIKDMATRSQKARRTGWHNRVLAAGYIRPGDELRLVERRNPEWPISRIQHFLYDETRNFEVMKDLINLKELGEEAKANFRTRVENHMQKLENIRLRKLEEATSGWSEYILIDKIKETEAITSFVFERLEKKAEPESIQPGSHVRVRVGGNLVRAYSIVEGNSNTFVLGISREVDSRGGSKYMHEKLKLHDILPFSKIASNFPLTDDPLCEKHVFIAGGVGITALLVSAFVLKERGAPFTFYYTVKREQDVAYRDLLDEFAENVQYCISEQGTRLDILSILKRSNNQTHIYICGPDRLLNFAKTTAEKIGFPAANIHSEAFVTSTSGDPFTVRIESQCKEVTVQEEETLLDVLRTAGLDVPSSCEVGNCGTCKVGVKSGRIEHRGTGLLVNEKGNAMLSCVSRGIGTICLEF